MIIRKIVIVTNKLSLDLELFFIMKIHKHVHSNSDLQYVNKISEFYLHTAVNRKLAEVAQTRIVQ